MARVRRYHCESCERTIEASTRRDPFRDLPERRERRWACKCRDCGGTLLDLSYPEARLYMDEQATTESERRSDLALSITAPFAFIGFGLGGAITYWLVHDHGIDEEMVLLIPLALCALFTMVPAQLIENRLRPRRRYLELTMREIEVLERIDERRRRSARSFAAEDPS